MNREWERAALNLSIQPVKPTINAFRLVLGVRKDRMS